MSAIVFDETYNGARKLSDVLGKADHVIVGAGAGLSSSAGFTYKEERFEKYFWDFIRKYGFTDMYSGGFYPYGTLEEFWAYWARYIYINRYMDAPRDTYDTLFSLIRDKDYFVLTTNVDHLFQKSGFDKSRLFYTQGDYGLLQCSKPCHEKTYDNKDIVERMLESQGFRVEDGKLIKDGNIRMEIGSSLIPHCPECGRPMSMNLRSDSTFVEDSGWHEAERRFEDFQRRIKRNDKVLYLELGVGENTPAIIKYPFMRAVMGNENACYATVNMGEAYTIDGIASRSIVINDDITNTLFEVKQYCKK